MYAVELNGLAIGRQIGWIHKYQYGGAEKEKAVSGWVRGVSHKENGTVIEYTEKKATAFRNRAVKLVTFDTEIGFLDGN